MLVTILQPKSLLKLLKCNDNASLSNYFPILSEKFGRDKNEGVETVKENYADIYLHEFDDAYRYDYFQ